MNPLDALDARILLALDEEPEATTLGLARALGVARNTVHARLRRLAAVLRPPSTRVDPAALGYPLTAFVSLSISQASSDATRDGLRGLPEVVEVHAITGEADLLVRVVARDTADLRRVTATVLGVPGVVRTSTAVSLQVEMPIRLEALLRQRAAG